MKIFVGTANWGKPYGHRQTYVDYDEKWRILDICDAHNLGLETAYDYGCIEELKGLSDQFEIIYKCDTEEQMAAGTFIIGWDIIPMKHHAPYGGWDTVSVYSPVDVDFNRVVSWEIPFNIVDHKRFSHLLEDAHTIARSVFIQGLAFQMPDFHGIPFYHLCWNFVRNNPNIDGIVVGVDSAAQLEDILSIPQYEIDYNRIGQDGWIKKY